MAQELSKTEIERLIRRSAAARARLTLEYGALRHRLDVPARIRGSLAAHPTGWMLGTAVAGFIASRIFRLKRARSSVPARGLLVTLLGLLAATAKPMLKVWLGGEIKRYLTQAPAPRRHNPPF
jgi:hypothetical protein